MAIYTIRPEFTIILGSAIHLGGDEVDLSEAEFELHKHKLQGTKSTVLPIEFPGNGNNSGYPAPHFAALSPKKVITGKAGKLIISGSFFTPEMTVTATGITVNQITFISDNQIELEVTAGSILGSFSLTLDNGKSTEVANAIQVSEPLIWDFRGGVSQTVVKGNSTNLVSNDYWLQVSCKGSSWQGSVRFVGDDNKYVWDRQQKQSLSWILFPLAMVGIGSNATNLNSTQQYYQGEILGFFNSSTNFYGFYGNLGNPGSGTSQYVNQSLNGADIIKLTLTNNGKAGGEYKIYDLTPDDTGWQQSGLSREQYLSQQLTVGNWYSTDNLIKSGEIASNMTANESEIMPFVALSTNNVLRLLGFYIE